MLRKHGVVGKFVEFYGAGVAAGAAGQPRDDRQHEPRSTARRCAIFPIDDETLHYLRFTGRADDAGRAGRGLRQGAGPVARRRARAALLRDLELDLSTVVPSHRRAEAPAGPRRSPTPSGFRRRCRLRRHCGDDGYDESSRVVPGLDARRTGNGSTAPTSRAAGRHRPAEQAHGDARRRHEFEIDHGAVVIAAITSCTNTSTRR